MQIRSKPKVAAFLKDKDKEWIGHYINHLDTVHYQIFGDFPKPKSPKLKIIRDWMEWRLKYKDKYFDILRMFKMNNRQFQLEILNFPYFRKEDVTLQIAITKAIESYAPLVNSRISILNTKKPRKPRVQNSETQCAHILSNGKRCTCFRMIGDCYCHKHRY